MRQPRKPCICQNALAAICTFCIKNLCKIHKIEYPPLQKSRNNDIIYIGRNRQKGRFIGSNAHIRGKYSCLLLLDLLLLKGEATHNKKRSINKSCLLLLMNRRFIFLASERGEYP